MDDRQAAAVPPPPSGRGSLPAGVACAWGMLIGGYAVVFALLGIGSGGTDGAFLLLLSLPWLGMIALAVWFGATGKSRSALGVVVGIGMIIAVGVLLVAACFGLLANGH